MPDFSGLAVKFGWQFKRPELLAQAFTHRSYLNEHSEHGQDNSERLEFLGDAVLELAVTEFLFNEYAQSDEGALTAYRAALVNTETLAQVATALGFNDYLLLSRGEAKDTGRARQSILADTFEAVVGAIFVDQGYAAAQTFIAQQLFPRVAGIVADQSWQDAKSNFQERAQALTGITPNYKVLSEAGPDHDRTFTVGLFLNDEQVATGTGASKQRAEQEAAKQGLMARGWEK